MLSVFNRLPNFVEGARRACCRIVGADSSPCYLLALTLALLALLVTG